MRWPDCYEMCFSVLVATATEAVLVVTNEMLVDSYIFVTAQMCYPSPGLNAQFWIEVKWR